MLENKIGSISETRKDIQDNGRTIETYQRSFERYHPRPPAALFPKIGGSQPPLKTAI